MIKKKAQVLSLDLVSSFMIFILIIALFVTVIIFSDIFDEPKSYDFELDYVFSNFENNLNSIGGQSDFLDSSNVDVNKLRFFADSNQDKSMDDLLIGNVTNTLGIGIYPEAYDTCFYFTDFKDNGIYEMSSGVKYLGKVKDENGVEVLCSDYLSQSNPSNPCEAYEDAVSLFKPVLLDFGNANENRIVQMNAVVCIL